ncbi:serine/threonine protein kinase [Microcoleus vaginatus]|uniref:serine/threonine protein kinase n=1 Tax=Microcoleus vaginatus TaxID=119532 RepID=UPI00403F976F
MTLISIPGYRAIEQLYSGSRTLVYRGFSESDNQPVVIKLLKSEYPTFSELVQFRNQYTIAKNIENSGIVKHLSLEVYRNGFALVMEDFGGISLAEYITNDAWNLKDTITTSLENFLQIAIKICFCLESIYNHQVIHKDIKPQNIIINPKTQEVKIIDFSISSLLPRENPQIKNPNILEGTLAYMSPEQTGRMNRGIDYRTDFYSLGVTFYELLTGQLPFQSNDPMELVHSHIARQPIHPIALNPVIPQVLNDIVLKLMAKTAEARYQTVGGIKHDLEKCLKEYSDHGTIQLFELGSRDISERFVIPEKLYGRESEVLALFAAFQRVACPPRKFRSRRFGGFP